MVPLIASCFRVRISGFLESVHSWHKASCWGAIFIAGLSVEAVTLGFSVAVRILGPDKRPARGCFFFFQLRQYSPGAESECVLTFRDDDKPEAA